MAAKLWRLAPSSYRLEPSHDSSPGRVFWGTAISGFASYIEENAIHWQPFFTLPGRTLAAKWPPVYGGSLLHLRRFHRLTSRLDSGRRASKAQHTTPVKAAGRLLHCVSPFGDWRDSLYSGTLAGGFYEGREGRDVLQAGLGGGSSATASAQPVRAAVARRLHQRGQTRRLLLGGCISAAGPGGNGAAAASARPGQAASNSMPAL